MPNKRGGGNFFVIILTRCKSGANILFFELVNFLELIGVSKSMHFFAKILLAFTIAVTLGCKPVIDLLVYDTLVAVVEENEEEEETSHNDIWKEWKFVRKSFSVVVRPADDDEVIHNFETLSLFTLHKGSTPPQPPEFI